MDTVTPSAAAAPTTRGRPREFDDDQVLDTVIQLFWTQGYEATSMADIVAATGLSKSSIYNSFGSKEGLFAAALDRYVDHRTAMLAEVLVNGTQGLADLDVLFDALWSEVAIGGDHRGCLAINTFTELGQRDENAVAVALRFRTTMRSSLEATLQRAADLGEIDPAMVGDYAALLLSFMAGTAVIVRGGAPEDEIRRQLDAVRTVVQGWRVEAEP